MERDSTLGTIVVALVLCVVCSVLVSTAAVSLRPMQEANKELSKKKNVLLAAGLADKKTSAKEVDSIFGENVETLLVNISEAEVVPNSEVEYETYNPREAADSEEGSQPIETEGATPGVKRREKLAFVYLVKEGDNVKQYVLPVYGKGLWSTLYGFLAIDADGRTIRGITFYEDKETPGLGGEINNDTWKAKWADEENPKYAYNDEGEVAIQVIKGTVAGNTPDKEYKVDGLSGATITSTGVTNLVQYWLGPDGFGPFLKKRTGNAPEIEN